MPAEPLIGLLAAAASLVAFAAIRRGLGREPWLDELATLDLIGRGRGFSRLLRDVHPPLFSLAAIALAAEGRDWRRLRLPNALATALAAGLVALVPAAEGWTAVLGAGSLAALAPFGLRTGSDLRPYGLALLGGALATWGAVRIDSTPGWAGMACGAALALGSHFAALALAPGWLLLAGPSWRSVSALLPGSALFLACLCAQREAVRRAAASWWMPAPTPRRLLRQVAVLGGGGRLGAALAFGALALAGLGAADPLGARLALGAAIGFAALISVSCLARPVIWPRTLLLLGPFVLAAAGVGAGRLARAAGLAAALAALGLLALGGARRILAAAWRRGDEPWSEVLAGTLPPEPAIATAACPPWTALGLEPATPAARVFRLPAELGREAIAELVAELAGSDRLHLVVRIDPSLLRSGPGFDSLFAALAAAPVARLRLSLVETPDRAILPELRALASSVRASATRFWRPAAGIRSGPGFEILELVRRDGPP